MAFFSNEMIEQVVTAKGNHIASTDFIQRTMDEIKKSYSSSDKETMGKEYNSVFEAELLSVYMKGFKDAITAFNSLLDNKGEVSSRSIEL